MIYISKPTQVDAFRWFGDDRQTEDPEWIVEGIKNKSVTFHKVVGEIRMRISALSCPAIANWAQLGDWIIRDEEGLHRVMSDEAFSILYEIPPNPEASAAAKPSDA